MPEWSSDDGHTDVTWLAGDDEWEGTCDSTPGDTNCDAYEIDTDESCTAVVTVGFFAGEDDEEPSRVEERTVALTADVPLVLVENYDEAFSDVGDVSCVTDGGADTDRVSATQQAEDHLDADAPAGCDEEDCVAFAVTVPADCAAAAVQFRVSASIGTVDSPHDLAVVTALRAGKASDVFVGGTTVRRTSSRTGSPAGRRTTRVDAGVLSPAVRRRPAPGEDGAVRSLDARSPDLVVLGDNLDVLPTLPDGAFTVVYLDPRRSTPAGSSGATR